MAFRNIIVESPAAISLWREQLIVRTDSEHSVPIEDISALLLESRQTTITTAALSRLGQRGCVVFTCDEKHLPCAVLAPYQQHSRGLAVLRMQMSMTEPTKKRLLFNCLNLDILSGRQHHSVAYAVERLIQSQGRAMERPETKLTLPTLLESEQHRYE